MYTINNRTTLKTIRNIVARDFGVIITNSEAKQIRDDVGRGVGALSSRGYVSTVTSGISQITGKSVFKNARLYGRKEWNADRKTAVTPMQQIYVQLFDDKEDCFERFGITDKELRKY